jgi:hypothetical protein
MGGALAAKILYGGGTETLNGNIFEQKATVVKPGIRRKLIRGVPGRLAPF